MIFNTIQFGGGARIDVKAVGDAASAVVGDKVILIPTEDLFWDDTLYASTSAATSSTSTQSWSMLSFMGGSLSTTKSDIYWCPAANTNSSQRRRYLRLTCTLDFSNPALVTGSSFDTVTSTSSSTTGLFTLVNYRDSFNFAAYGVYGGNNSPFVIQTVGRVVDNNYQSIGSIPVTVNDTTRHFPAGISYVDGHLSYLNWYGTITDSSVSWYQLGTTYSSFYKNNAIPVKYKGNWYVIMGGAPFSNSGSYVVGQVYSYGTTTTSSSYPAGGTYVYCDTQNMLRDYYLSGNVYYIDDDTEYFWIGSTLVDYTNVTWAMWRLVKGAGTWKFEPMPEATSMIHEVLSNNNTINIGSGTLYDWFTLNCKDRGDTVEIITAPQYKNLSANATLIGHFSLDKASGKMTRLPDILKWSDVGSSMQRVCSLQVNWDIGLVCIGVSDQSSDTQGTMNFIQYFRKLDSVPKIYPYYGYPNDRNYYFQDAITGFVRANKGVNEIGDTVLTVETVEDPGISWDNRGILYGMEITINGSF